MGVGASNPTPPMAPPSHRHSGAPCEHGSEAATRLLASIPPLPLRDRRLTIRVTPPDQAPAVFTIDDASYRSALIGTSPLCDVRIEDSTVSRRHASIESDGTGLLLSDLGSRNGTFVAGRRVKQIYVEPGDRITVGESVLRLETDGAPRPVAASSLAQFGRAIGSSPSMRTLFARLEDLALADQPVLIEGEAGTGKSLVAEAVHERSARRGGPFVFADAGAPAAAIDTELFGARSSSISTTSLFARAHGGTLYIAEIGRLALPTQVRLVRYLESAASGQQVVRLIAGTRQNLDRAVQDRTFREELIRWLARGRVEIPPLRKRPGDVALLTSYFWLTMGGRTSVPAALVESFEAHPWPGNVRELETAIARALVAGEARASAAEVRQSLQRATDFIDVVAREPQPLARGRAKVIEEFERRYVRYALEAHDGHVGRAAAAAGIGRRHFQTLRTGK